MKWIGQNIYDDLALFRGNVRIGGGNVYGGDGSSNNWLMIDCQDGNDTSGGGITFHEATLSGSVDFDTPQYGAKIVYNEDDDEFSIGTIENSTFNKQIKMARNSNTVNITSLKVGGGYGDTGATINSAGVGTFNGALTTDGLLTAGNISTAGYLTVNGSTNFTSSSLARPLVQIKNTGNNASGGAFQFVLDKGAVGADNDAPGSMQWISDNDAQEQITFGQLYTSVADATDGQEAGAMFLQVAEYDGTLTTGLKLDGDTDANGEIDVTIGAGVASDTTVAGNLTLGGQLKKRLHYIHTTFKANNAMDTERYVSLVDADREATAEDNLAIVAVMPATGVLKRVIWNTSSDLSAKSWTFKFKKIPSGTGYTSETLVATVTKQATSGMGGASTNSIIDFTTDASDADNACTFETGFSTSTQFSVGDRVLFSFESNTAPSGQPKCNLTFVFELDESTAF